ncbi:MAG: hypothetical protein NWF09_08900 [Candidatus Bathyarchaeota archaeon]|nr:hypothetical protein [Candidatus Bathyarchaeota archaeon]
MKIIVHSWNGKIVASLPLHKWLKLKIFGKKYFAHDKKPGWHGSLPFYIVKCNVHGYFLDYPHGFNGYFTCPMCR